MRSEGPNKHYSYTFAFLFFFVTLFPDVCISANTLSATDSLTSNKTLVSPGDVFELGFFKILSDSWYLGIWYKTLPQKTYVWIANRDNPLFGSTGVLKISNANLILQSQTDTLVWSTNLTGAVRAPMVAELLDNGNFVLRDSKTNGSDGFLWQSFDFPTDTLLPQMKLGRDHKRKLDRFLTSWKSSFDLSNGDYLFKLETQGLPEFFLWKKFWILYRSGPWDGSRFSGMSEIQQWDDIIYNLTDNSEEVAFTFRLTDHNLYSRLTINDAGLLQQFTWDSTNQEWNMLWSTPKEKCDYYDPCGPYAYCDMSTSPMCNCIEGFAPRNSQEWASGIVRGRCQRKTQLSCGGDRFIQLKKVKLPDTTEAIVDKRLGLEDCKKRCATNCNCTAYATMDIRNGGLGCVIWIGRFVDIRNYAATGQDLYVRLAAADIGDKRNIIGKIIGLIIGVSLMLLMSFIIMYRFWRKNQKRAIAAPIVYRERYQEFLTSGLVISSDRHLSGDKTEELELPHTEFEAVVMATDNFSDSNILGRGGFGIVYKGRLLGSQNIAVKRLSTVSSQGTNEFKNEVRLIARLQHINLVRLLSCCIYADEKILIYEYLGEWKPPILIYLKNPKRSRLNWQKRFNIINGIARGLLYLHQDSRFKIIHRDLKASNVLLDKDMTPKISDFGMARMFERDETEANTRKVVGTYGYMSPEYAMDGIFSVKSDVFSFGVLVLEIVSGKRNRRNSYNSNQENNPSLATTWDNWKEGKGLEIVDPVIVDSSSFSTFQPHEVLRCLQIGLLCVQERAEDRPKMSSVVLMLGNETGEIHQPKLPGYCVGRSFFETESSSSTQRDSESLTVNQFTVSVIDAR
uniref:Receptor-like serine/threonine-protein kinase n=2 Tax=Capsella grandiflora TaxID=264402 RepID=A5A5D8_9BRAS|nr:S-locus receptor kinase SRK7 [Capsella grandiflora]